MLDEFVEMTKHRPSRRISDVATLGNLLERKIYQWTNPYKLARN